MTFSSGFDDRQGDRKIFRQTSIKKQLFLRSAILQSIRAFFIQHGFLEVETPIRIPAPAPEGHIDAQPSGPWYLQTSPELCMKTLLAAGYPRIFQICKCFRQKERGRRHLPELTMLEWYRAGADYGHLMRDCEALFQYVMAHAGSREGLVFQGQTIDLNSSWDKLSVRSAFEQYAAVSMDEALRTDRFDEILAFEIEPRLGFERPVFLMDYPAAKGALARLKPENPSVAERFELYIHGIELCNAFSELNDAAQQRRRFEAEQSLKRSRGKPLSPMPESFLSMLESMPDAAGIALGVDRMVMLLADTTEIDDVVAFTPEEL
jgi:lysyl-tRNA synthetase class 2